MSNTGTNISIIEKNMPMGRIAPLVEALDMDKKRFMATVLLACERTPKLMNFPVQSHVQWASGAAALGLEPDGISGQAYPIPFGNKVQLIVGYKGFNTMAGRAGITINSGVLMDGDEFPNVIEAGRPFWVKPKFGNRADANLIGSWAQAQMPNRSWGPVTLLDLSEILAVKAKAPGGRKSDSPWNDVKVGFPAMAQKTAVRRLQRTLSSEKTRGRTWSTHAVAAEMDMRHEEVGQHTHVDLEGHLHAAPGPIIDAKVEPVNPGIQPALLLPNGSESCFKTWTAHTTVTAKLRLTDKEMVAAIFEINKGRLSGWRASDNAEAQVAAVAIIGAMMEVMNDNG